MTEPTGSEPTPDQAISTDNPDPQTEPSVASAQPTDAAVDGPVPDVGPDDPGPAEEAARASDEPAAAEDTAKPDASAEPTADAAPEAEAQAEPDSEPEPVPTTWDELDLPPSIRSAVDTLGWTQPTPVQGRTFKTMVAGTDVLVQSQTGSGKTGAFCLPWLASRFEIGPADVTGVQLLVLLPTRELAKQVCDELSRLAIDSPVDVLPVYGGTAMSPQLDALAKGVHAVVGTPGRILDHIRRKSLNLSRVRTVVLDECDEMLSMGFLEDIRAILSACPRERQTCLFSATVPRDIERIAGRHMQDPVRIELSGDEIAAAEIDHAYYSTMGTIKTRDLLDVIMLEDPPTAIVFCNTREETRLVANVLQKNGYSALALSSDLTQAAREKVMAKFREHKLRFLVATDVAARGIDVSHVSHVINYSFPENAEVYVHRTGRTGRAGRAGQALSIVSALEIGSFYTLTKSYKSIHFTERRLPPGEELAATRTEVKLDRISHEFSQPVSPEWLLLARRLLQDPRGERVVAYLLHEALESQRIRGRQVEEDEAPEQDQGLEELREGARDRGRGGRDRDRRGGRDRGERDRGERDRGDRDRGDRDRGRGRRDERRTRGPDDQEGPRRRDRDGDRDRRRRDQPRSEQGEALATEPPTESSTEIVLVDDSGEVEITVESTTPDERADALANEMADSAGEDGDAIEDSEADSDGDARPKKRRRRRRRRRGPGDEVTGEPTAAGDSEAASTDDADGETSGSSADGDGDGDEDDDEDDGAADGDSAEAADGEPRGKRKRRRRRRRRGGGKTGEDNATAAPQPAAESSRNEDGGRGRGRRRRRRDSDDGESRDEAPVEVQRLPQDQIVIDIDETELTAVRDTFGEIDELDELTLKGRRRAVLDDLTDEVEVEDLTDSDAQAEADAQADADAEDDEDDEYDDGELGDADGPATDAGLDTSPGTQSDDEAEGNGDAGEVEGGSGEKKKRRRRRRRKKAPPPPPELTCPPHKDFWEVWANKFSAADFTRDDDRDEDSDETNEPAAAPAITTADDDDTPDSELPLIDDTPNEDALVRVDLNIGRRHGHKAAHVRALLRRLTGLHGKAVKDLTVREQNTLFRMDVRHFEAVVARLDGSIVDDISLTLVQFDEGGAAVSASEPSDAGDGAEPALEGAASESVAEAGEGAADAAGDSPPPAADEPTEAAVAADAQDG